MRLTVGQAIEEFLDACRADGLKLPTVRWYEGKLRPLTAMFGRKAIDRVETADMRDYVRSLHDRTTRYVGVAKKHVVQGGLSIESIRGHIRCLRRFWGWCEAEYRLDPGSNPMLRIKMPPAPRAIPKDVSPESVRVLLESCDDSVTGRRDCAVIAFLADTGCRAGGLLRLTPDVLDVDARRAQVHEKGEKGRLVPFSEYTAERLREWLAVRPDEAPTVFCSLGTNTHAQPMTLSALHKILKRRAAEAHVTGRINPHSFRHSFARRWMLAGGDVSTLSLIMGHSTSKITTDVYGAFMHEEALTRYEELALMDKLLKGRR